MGAVGLFVAARRQRVDECARAPFLKLILDEKHIAAVVCAQHHPARCIFRHDGAPELETQSSAAAFMAENEPLWEWGANVRALAKNRSLQNRRSFVRLRR